MSTAMKKIVLFSACILITTFLKAQVFSGDKLLDMLTLSQAKLENQLADKRYRSAGTESFGDTIVKSYEYRPVIRRSSSKKQTDPVSRKFFRSVLKQTFKLTYQTTAAAEYTAIIEALKKNSFYCEYEKDSTITPAAYLYQHEDYTADCSVQKTDGTTWYTVTVFKKTMPVTRDIHFAEDLLEFTSHEYLVYYFGAKNVKTDVYYFAKNDIAKCSVLFINTKLQVIFVWKDGLNKRKIDNLLFGGQHKLKSQQEYDKVIAENSWTMKSGLHAGMPLMELRTVNERNISFCGGDAPNPGLVFSESSGKIDFRNADVILGCINCTDDKFQASQVMYADKAMDDGRVLFVLTIALYPMVTGVFE
jgi:hypothetical protein